MQNANDVRTRRNQTCTRAKERGCKSLLKSNESKEYTHELAPAVHVPNDNNGKDQNDVSLGRYLLILRVIHAKTEQRCSIIFQPNFFSTLQHYKRFPMDEKLCVCPEFSQAKCKNFAGRTTRAAHKHTETHIRAHTT